MEHFKKYPSLENLYKATGILEHEYLVVTEKIHGTNARFMHSPEHGLVIGSRNNTVFIDGEVKREFYGFTTWLQASGIPEKIKAYPDHTFYGEFFGGSIQSGIDYGPDKYLRIFDIRNPEATLLDHPDVVAITKELDIPMVPVLFEGKVTLEELKKNVDDMSLVGMQNDVDSDKNYQEGFVIRAVPMAKDAWGNTLIVKYKSEKWAENAKAPKVKEVSEEKILLRKQALEFAESVVTPGRVATICDHITRDEDVELEMKHTPVFLREMVNDIMKEHSEIYEKLEKPQVNAFNKAVSTNAVPLFKKHLYGDLV